MFQQIKNRKTHFSRICTGIFIVLLLCVFLSTISFNLSENNKAFAVVNNNGDTSLFNGHGAQFGINSIRTSINNGNGEYTSGGNVSGDDVRVINSSYIKFSPTTLTMTGELISKVTLDSTDPSYNALFLAIQNPDMAVMASLSFTASSENNTVITAKIDWNGDNIISENINVGNAGITHVTQPTTLSAGGNVASKKIQISIKSTSRIELSNIKLNVSANIVGLTLGNASFTIEGVNRETVTFKSDEIKQDGINAEAYSKIFVKAGDIITFNNVAKKSNSDYNFPVYYNNVFGEKGSTDTNIMWKEDGTNCLERIMDVDPNKNGQVAKFKVLNNASNENTINLKSFIYTGIGVVDGQIIRTSSPSGAGEDPFYSYTLKIDSSAPNKPAFMPEDALFKSINNDKYYTDGLKVNLNLYEASGVKSTEYLYVTLDGTDPRTSNTRQKIRETAMQNGSLSFTKTDLVFPGVGTFVMRIVGIDTTGNIGSELVFDGSENKRVKIDNNKYNVILNFGLPGKDPQLATQNDVKMLGDTFIFVGTLPTLAETLTATKNAKFAASREQNISIRTVFTVDQLGKYPLTRFANGDNTLFNSAIVLNEGIVSGNKYYYYDVTFNIDDSMLTDTKLNINFFFKERLIISFTQNIYEYTGNPQSVGESVLITNQKNEILTNVKFSHMYADSKDGNYYLAGGQPRTSYTDAGSYWVKVVIDDDDYVGNADKAFIINKATPKILELRVADINYSVDWSLLTYSSRDNLGNITENNISSIGVKGRFEVPNPPAKGALGYIAAGTYKNITVNFYPEDKNEINGGKHNGNYAVQTIAVDSIVVRHLDAKIAFDADTMSHTYDGTQKQASVITTVGSGTIIALPILYQYKIKNTPDSTYTYAMPSNAGSYTVRATVGTHEGYAGSQDSTTDFVINKRKLDLALTLAPEVYYGRMVLPNVIATFTTNGAANIINVGYSYYYAVKGTKDFKLINLPLVPQNFNIGEYDIKVEVNNANNMGDNTVQLKIVPVQIDANGWYNINYPGIIRYNDGIINGHIAYLSALSQVRIETNPIYNAKYKYAGSNESFIIPGRFYLEGSDRILKAGEYTGNTSINMWYQAGSYVNGQFVANENFAPQSIPRDVTIDKARATFTSVSLGNITYGQKVSDIIIAGNPSTPGKFECQQSLEQVLSQGKHSIQYKFTPEDMDNFYTLERVMLDVEVLAKAATVSFDGVIGKVYGSIYANPKVITSPANLTVVFTYTTMENEPISINSLTNVGSYKVFATISDTNYSGSISGDYIISKANLIVGTPPIAPLTRYGAKLGDITLSGGDGLHEESGIRVKGQFVFEELDQLADIGTKPYKVIFIPSDEQDKLNYNQLSYNFSLTISKAIIIPKVVSKDYIYTGVAKAPAITAVDPLGNTLTLKFDYGTGGSATPVNAGTYKTTASIDNTYYEGEVKFDFIIDKANVVINNQQQVFSYDGQQKQVSIITNPINLNFDEKYYDYRNVEMEPIGVGKYKASIVINETNYKGSAEIILIIQPQNIIINNLEQKYGTVIPVTISSIPEALNYNVLYRLQGTNNPFELLLRTDAGKYDVKIVIDHHDYIKEITTLEENPLTLNIAKGDASIGIVDILTFDYIGRAHTLSANTSPSGLQTVWHYKPYGADDSAYSTTQPFEVGQYYVKIEVVNNNYTAVKVVTLDIKPAKLRIDDLPKVVSENPYNINKEDIKFGGGIVIFGATGQIMTSEGKFSVTDETNHLFVGVHDNIAIQFYPNDDKNFLPVAAKIKLTISKKNISDSIQIAIADFEKYYNQSGQSLEPYIVDGTIPSGYPKLKIKVLYDGNQNLPINVGEYMVSATIDDSNYGGAKIWDTKFAIKPAPVSFVKPTLSDILIGSIIGTSVITGGEGYIINASGIKKPVTGKFTFEYPDTIMNKANKHEAMVRFTPDMPKNYVYSILEVLVNVKGTDATIETQPTATGIAYGATLSYSTLSVKYNVDGIATWDVPDQIVNVGAKAKYKFTPTDEDKYNIMYGEVALDISLADIFVKELNAYVYVGNLLHTAEFTAKLTNQMFDNIKVDGKFTILTANREVGSSEESIEISYKIEADNYNTYVGTLTVKCYKKVTTIAIGKTTKFFDGNPIKIGDLGISVGGTEHTITDFALTFYKNGIIATDIYSVGTYKIIIKIVDSVYAGQTEITFNIIKRDVTSSIIVKNQEKTYAQDIAPIATFGEWQVSPSSVRFNYWSEDGKLSYGSILPQDAGKYKATVSIMASDETFSGEYEFIFIINRKLVDVTLNNEKQKFGEVKAIIPSFGNNSFTSGDYKILFDGNEVFPYNAGNYNMKLEITHKNFFCENVTAVLTIDKATLSIAEEDYPKLSDIRFGQKFGDSNIDGGNVYFGSEKIPVKGDFSIINKDSITDKSGKFNVDIIFKPTNANYKDLEFSVPINVQKGIGSIDIGATSKVYNRSSQLPDITTNPVKDIRIAYTIYKNSTIISSAVDAGNYTIRLKFDDDNYVLNFENADGSTRDYVDIEFTITKARANVDRINNPTPSDISFGQSLSFSTLNGGSISYIDGQDSVLGKFVYIDIGLVLGNVGKYTVKYKFIPNDVVNYDEYVGSVDVNVKKAKATIDVTSNNFIYGLQITEPTFITYPNNLKVLNTQMQPIIGTIMDVGTYSYKAIISDDNYEGELNFGIIVSRKTIEVSFYDGETTTNFYRTEFNKIINAKAKINIGQLIEKDIPDKELIEKYLKYSYTNANGNAYSSSVPPINVGEYRVSASLDHKNYTINTKASFAGYNILVGEVTLIEFDTNSLSNQIYGSASTPIILTQPAGVKYVVKYPGYEFMPTSAGSYNIKVIVTDPNYRPTEKNSVFRILQKEITIEDIVIKNRATNGVSSVDITGSLKGVMVGDEVKLKLTAHTKDNVVDSGVHSVVISSYEISGLHHGNYKVLPPIYNNTVKFTKNIIVDDITNSYVTSPDGFLNNVTVSFSQVTNAQNKTNIFSKLFGQKASVQSISIKEYGQTISLSKPVKFYIRIPDEYLTVQNLEVNPLGALADRNIFIQREGDYMTFWADTSGEIVFSTNDFPYWTILVAAAILVIFLGLLTMYMLSPVRRNKKVSRRIRGEIEYAKATANIRKR